MAEAAIGFVYSIQVDKEKGSSKLEFFNVNEIKAGFISAAILYIILGVGTCK